MFSPKFLVNANEASKNVDVINENFRNIKVDLEYLNDLDKRISDIDARTKCVNPERIRRDYLSIKSELNGKLYGSISDGRIPQKDPLNENKLNDTSWEAYYEHLQPINDNESDVGQSLKRVKTAYAYVVNALTGIYRAGLELASVFAPISHASNGTTHGISDSFNYGHAKSSTTNPLMDGTADPGTAGALFANYNHRHPSDTAKANMSGGNTFSGKQNIAASSATEAGINYGGTGTAPSSPVDGDMWKTAVAFFVRIASTTYQLAMLSLAQTWSAVQTFSATPVISSKTAATTAGAFYRIDGRNPVFYEGMVRQLSAVFFRGSTATTVNSNSSTTVSMAVAQGTATVPANALGIRGSKLRVTVTAAVSVTGGTLYITVKIGNVEIATTILTSPQVGNMNSITFEAVVVTAGASGVIHGGAYVSSAGSNSSSSSPASLDTTASNAITCTGLWTGVAGTASVSVLTAEII